MPFEAITILCPDESELLVRRYEDGSVEVDLRTQTTKYGPRVWTPVELLGGSFTVEQVGEREWNRNPVYMPGVGMIEGTVSGIPRIVR